MLTIEHVLLPTDHAAWSEHAFAHAAYFAGRHGATLHVLHVVPGPRGGAPPEAPGMSAGEFRAYLRLAAAEATGLDVVHAELPAPTSEEGILDYAGAHDVDLVVMATHGRTGLAHFVRGSVAEAVVRRAPCPVLTVGPAAARAAVEVRRVLVPVDLSAPSQRAVAHAAVAHAAVAHVVVAHAKELAALFGAELHLLHVLPAEPLSPYADVDLSSEPPGEAAVAEAAVAEARRELLDLYAGAAGPAGPVAAHVAASPLAWPTVGDGDASPPAAEILSTAAEVGADLIVMGSHGRRGLKRVLLGSVAEEVVQKAPCPVLVVKPAGKSLLAGGEAPGGEAAEAAPLAPPRA